MWQCNVILGQGICLIYGSKHCFTINSHAYLSSAKNMQTKRFQTFFFRDADHERCSVCPDLGPNCFQMVSAVDKSHL